ncbi:hypothetical protein [Brevundimonas aurifodinae]|uniref:Uncharacterized protein n=2 Tax=Brevundimonas TaxID=41275 RepID=A0ABV1NP13_9CAUL|nr:MAG: hypothetical protein B7Z42_06865 [Brevundimonas sp. 12-68-7]OYX34420.1 MAG: hypothetical protein B7Z01_06145 [Brevundimonas subvibrioides]
METGWRRTGTEHRRCPSRLGGAVLKDLLVQIKNLAKARERRFSERFARGELSTLIELLRRIYG